MQKPNNTDVNINLRYPPRKDYLPTSRDEMDALGWDQADIIIFSGDAYVDHPSFGAAVIGRTLQKAGYRVAIVPQPNWRDDLRDFKKLGAPRLFFGISAGAMDSMVNHYTANRRLRHDDAYTAGGKHGMRPDYPTIAYSKILRKLFPDTPVIAGSIEASLRRVAHYDYWEDRLRPSILADAAVDMLIYGMGERTVVELASRLADGIPIRQITDVPQTAFFSASAPDEDSGDIILHSFGECLRDKRKQAINFRKVEEESNRMHGNRIWQQTGKRWICINPMYPPADPQMMDSFFDLPFTRMPHPRYKGKRIPAYEMIRHSICMHRGCFGGCAFCTISAHQGKFVSSRSVSSIVKEAKKVVGMPDFKGYISDLGGPSANMYSMRGKDISKCEKCLRPSCLFPAICSNLNNDHGLLLDVYRKVDSLPEVKKSFVGSGVRYDLSMSESDNPQIVRNNARFNEELIARHVSGRLKVAPEHTEDNVLRHMRKPSFALFRKFKRIFDKTNAAYGLRQQLIPYFISSHPGCTLEDMAELAAKTKDLDFHLEQVQDFTPTPMTLATEIYYTGFDPYSGKEVPTARDNASKLRQREFFFWYDPGKRKEITGILKEIGRSDLAERLYPSDKVTNGNRRRKRMGSKK